MNAQTRHALTLGVFLAVFSFTLTASLRAEKNSETDQPVVSDAPDQEGMLEKVSYFLGSDAIARLKKGGIDVQKDAYLQGTQDALEGKETQFPREELEEALMTYQTQLQLKAAKEKEMTADNKSKEGAAFLEKNGKRTEVNTTASGLQYEVLTAGSGAKPTAEKSVTVHYTGTLLDGTVFDSSVQRGEPATFGVSQVISGWTEALQLMAEGSKWKLFIPSELAYGSKSPGPDIGPNSTLVFEVELLKVN